MGSDSNRTAEVRGSIPLSSTSLSNDLAGNCVRFPSAEKVGLQFGWESNCGRRDAPLESTGKEQLRVEPPDLLRGGAHRIEPRIGGHTALPMRLPTTMMTTFFMGADISAASALRQQACAPLLGQSAQPANRGLPARPPNKSLAAEARIFSVSGSWNFLRNRTTH